MDAQEYNPAGAGVDPPKHPVSPRTVRRLLNGLDYSLQGNRKTLEGSAHPDRNTQFEYINASVKQFQLRGQPVISVYIKKKEFVGAFKNGGREWQPKGESEKVKVNDTARFVQHPLPSGGGEMPGARAGEL